MATFVGYAPATSVHSRALYQFQGLLEERSGGELRIDVTPNILDLGLSAEDMLRRTESGEFAGCYLSTSYLTGHSPKLAVFDLPFLIDSRDHAYRILDGPIGSAMAQDLARGGKLEHLGFWENGFRHVSNTKRPIRVPSDLEGLRIRLQPNELHQAAFRLLGAIPVLTDVSDLITAFEDGRVDAQENPLDNTWTYGVYRHTKYISLTAHFFGVREMLANRAWFEALPPRLQVITKECALEATAFQRELANQRDAEITSKLLEHGCLINPVEPADRGEFRRRVEPLYDDAAATIGPDTLQAVRTVGE